MDKSLLIWPLILFLLISSCARPREGDSNQNPGEELQGLTNRQIIRQDEFVSKNRTVQKPTEKGIFHAKIARVLDGDTQEIEYHDITLKIRLNNIDAPEKRGGQPYWKAARRELSILSLDKDVLVVSEGKLDGFGRLIAEIYVNDININKEMVRRGYAWHFKEYSDDESYAELEKQARSKKVGLWQDQNPIPPWIWRKK